VNPAGNDRAEAVVDSPAGPGGGPPISRRDLLRLTAIGGGSALNLGLLSAAASASAATAPRRVKPLPKPPKPPVPNPANGVELFGDSSFNFEALFALGAAASGAGEVGEVIATVNAINAEGPSFQSYYDNFVATAQRVERIADNAMRGGHRVSAREAYLRSAQYYDQALFFVLGTRAPHLEARVYANMQRQWSRAARLFDPPLERVAIPYRQTTLPGYFLKPDRRAVKRPTVIINNGSDAENIDVWTYGGAAAIARGYNALIFEGPGQGSTLFERGIPFRPDWERVITPIVDFLHGRRDVDTRRIAMTGWSFAGELVIRAAAFEERIVAVVADPGSIDTWLAYPPSIRDLLKQGGTRDEVNDIWTGEIVPSFDDSLRFLFKKRAEIFGRQFLHAARKGTVFSDFWTFGKRASQYSNASVIDRVSAPVLVLDYQLEQFYPGQARELYRRLKSRKKLATLQISEGAEYHDAPMAPQRRNQVVFDWLDRTLG
jgi:hypothetical protein